MCGIIGILGKEMVAPSLLEGLRRLEYRGYDSACIATLVNGRIERRRVEGKLDNLAKRLEEAPVQGARRENSLAACPRHELRTIAKVERIHPYRLSRSLNWYRNIDRTWELLALFAMDYPSACWLRHELRHISNMTVHSGKPDDRIAIACEYR